MAGLMRALGDSAVLVVPIVAHGRFLGILNVAATDRPDPGGPVNSQACVIPAPAPGSPATIAAAAVAAWRRVATASS